MSDITERVARGAAFLDEHEPGWDQRIDLYTLDLSSECRCVLGQLNTDLAHDWGLVIGKYGLVRIWNFKPGAARDYELGFNISDNALTDEEIENEYYALTAEWQRVIEARRSA